MAAAAAPTIPQLAGIDLLEEVTALVNNDLKAFLKATSSEIETLPNVTKV
jgi:hypothetical protein